MIKILFLIHDLGHGGAEKVLVNLVNYMDKDKFDITVMTLFDEGVNKQFLASHIKYKSCFKKSFRGNSHFMKFFSPTLLHKIFIKDIYDIEIAYLEGPSARVISGCKNKTTKLISWIHIEQKSKKRAARSFRSYNESVDCYSKFSKIICVSEGVRSDFSELYPLLNTDVLYNTNETEKIVSLSNEIVDNSNFNNLSIKIIGVGKLLKNKGFDRLARIHCKLRKEGYNIHSYVLGVGDQKKSITDYIKSQDEESTFTLLGYDTNPYKFVSKADLFICSSHSEGFSTAATEALIVGTPVCTVEVAGMKEMLGENNEYGIVTENNEEALYEGIKSLLDNPDLLKHYKEKAIERGKFFSTEKTVKAVEDMLLNL
ncbi:MAG: glycosyltransferase [Clostridia bacterium]|nr:glycosyltransferase [Clostridia bacterium]